MTRADVLALGRLRLQDASDIGYAAVHEYFARLVVGALVVIGVLVLLAAPTLEASSPTTISITAPQSGSTIVNTSLQISGRAPPQSLISLVILDTDVARTNIAQQPGGRIQGSVTSDATGNWVFVPPTKVVPGTFSVTASYTVAGSPTINSGVISFVVVDSSGASAVPSSSTTLGHVIVALLIIAAIVGIVLLWRRRRVSPRMSFSDSVRAERPRSHESNQEPFEYRHEPFFPPSPDGHEVFRPPDRGRHGEVLHVGEQMEPASAQPATRAAVRHASEQREEPEPLFMSTARGRSYQHAHEGKVRAMNDAMKEIERALGASAEALELSNTTISILRHQIDEELSRTEAGPDGDGG